MGDERPLQVKDFHHLPRSRTEARRLGHDRFFTGKACKHGHLAARYTSTSNCARCQLEHARKNGGWNARPSKEEYMQIARDIAQRHGGTVLSARYESARSKITIRCRRGHEFAVTPDNLKRGRWCSTCKSVEQSERVAKKFRTVRELCEFASREHGGDCLATSPTRMHARVPWKCSDPSHEPFVASISNVIHAKQWCPTCWAERRRPPQPPIPKDQIEQIVKERGGQIVKTFGKWAGGKKPEQ